VATSDAAPAERSRVSVAARRRELRQRQQLQPSAGLIAGRRNAAERARSEQSAEPRPNVLSELLAPVRSAAEAAEMPPNRQTHSPVGSTAGAQRYESAAASVDRTDDPMRSTFAAGALARLQPEARRDELFEDAYRHGVDLT
jgi:hypothetical protein